MDSLTQIVLGAAVGEAVLGKKVGNRAMLWGAVAGTIPDLDVILRFITDPVTATEMHRGFSHSFVFSILMAPILGWIVHWIHRNRDATRSGWSWLFFWSLVTHPLLDMHTTWGTQFFWPFETRVAYKNIFVVDPMYTVPFLVCLLIALLTKRTNPQRRRMNNLGLYISTSYMVLSLVFKWITYNEFKYELKKEGIDYVEMDTRPTPFNTILWNAQVETKNGFRMAYYSLFDSKKVRFSEEMPKNHELLVPYKNQKVIQQLIKISAGWYMIEEGENGRLFFVDLRFGQIGFDPDESPFLWKFELVPDAQGKIKAEKIGPDMTKIGGYGDAFGSLWDRILGN